jgi:hypothetical protein
MDLAVNKLWISSAPHRGNANVVRIQLDTLAQPATRPPGDAVLCR